MKRIYLKPEVGNKYVSTTNSISVDVGIKYSLFHSAVTHYVADVCNKSEN